MPTTLPGRLRVRIRQLGMTAADFATLADVNRSFIYDIIRARSGKPSLERLERVAKVLKVDCDWLLHGVGHVEGRLPQADDEFIAIAHAAARPSMGGGAVVEDEERPGRDYHFSTPIRYARYSGVLKRFPIMPSALTSSPGRRGRFHSRSRDGPAPEVQRAAVLPAWRCQTARPPGVGLAMAELVEEGALVRSGRPVMRDSHFGRRH